jgi:hypothetical protein
MQPILPTPLERGSVIVADIRRSGMTIYDQITIGDPRYWLPAPELEAVLDRSLRNLDLRGYPLRTRSKIVKSAVCTALGYPIPTKFTKVQPRFFGQRFDVYTQKSTNLQVWNEELEATRRYVLLHVNAHDRVDKVKVVTGDRLAELDTTGKLTQKYQASFVAGVSQTELVSAFDTDNLAPLVSANPRCGRLRSIAYPTPDTLLSISDLFNRLKGLVGKTFRDRGSIQDRNRGGDLHRLVCQALDVTYEDDGSCPDIKAQLLEMKLQMSSTIDLGLICPDSTKALDIPLIEGRQIRHCDVRYLTVGAATNGVIVSITSVHLVTGEDFFSRFRQFGGLELNKKLQVPLPRDFFET